MKRRGRVEEEEELHVFFCSPLKVSPVDSGADIKLPHRRALTFGLFDEDPLTSEIITLLLRKPSSQSPLPPTLFAAAPTSPFTFTESGTVRTGGSLKNHSTAFNTQPPV